MPQPRPEIQPGSLEHIDHFNQAWHKIFLKGDIAEIKNSIPDDILRSFVIFLQGTSSEHPDNKQLIAEGNTLERLLRSDKPSTQSGYF